jgi:signal transduction histidine kinase
MRNKRIIASVLAVFSLAILLTACGTGSASKKVTLNVFNWGEYIGETTIAEFEKAYPDIKVNYERDSEMFTIKGDYTRLRQLFLTIVDNAVKFSSENSEVKISLKENIVSIKDNGAGIDEGDIHYIFERFYKEKSEQNKEGTGLGLAIAKQIAERHGIKISVKSKRNEGTEFILEFKKNEEE